MKSTSWGSLESMTWKVLVLCGIVSVLTLAGCGGSGENVVTVSGKVSAEGKPVTAGTLIFAPAGNSKNPGTPSAVPIKADGTFESKAVVIGKNTVLYNCPSPAFPEGYAQKPSEAPPESPYSGLFPESKDIDVKSDTTLEIKLIRKD